MADYRKLPHITAILEGPPPAFVDGPGGLVDLVGRLFHCMNGPERAFFAYPAGDIIEGEDHSTISHHYDTWWLGIRGDGEKEQVEALVGAMWLEFKRCYVLLAERGYEQPVLFWRLTPIMAAGYSEASKSRAVKLRCRLAIPGIGTSPVRKGDTEAGRMLNEAEVIALRAQLYPNQGEVIA